MVACKSILYCTDFSEGARLALPHAVDMAKKYGAMLHLVHVYQEPDHLSAFELSADVQMEWVRVAQSVGVETDKKLEQLCNEVSAETGPCTHKVLRGRPHVEIIRYARENHVDLIILASHGLSGWEHVLFGSTAERVVREGPCTVMVVKRHV